MKQKTLEVKTKVQRFMEGDFVITGEKPFYRFYKQDNGIVYYSDDRSCKVWKKSSATVDEMIEIFSRKYKEV